MSVKIVAEDAKTFLLLEFLQIDWQTLSAKSYIYEQGQDLPEIYKQML